MTTAKKGTDLLSHRTLVDGKDVITVSGKIALGSEEHHIYKNISNPSLYAGANFRSFLKQRGIEVDGKYSVGLVPASARLAVDDEGDPLVHAITDMDKFSSNFVAEMLIKNLGAFRTTHQGHMSDGVDQVRQFLTKELGWSDDSLNSPTFLGFTRKNSFTAKQFTQVLSWVEKQFKIFPEYLQSLPVAGVDGTLQKRMKNREGWVRAKTGLLSGVVALSGYVGRPEGNLFFAFIYNGAGDESHVRDTFDAMATSLTQ